MIKVVYDKIKSVVVGFFILLAIIINVMACTGPLKQAVYIPNKCKVTPPAKPTPSKDSSVSQDVAEILQYTENLERDLDFCTQGVKQ